MMDVLVYADGETDLLSLAETIGADIIDCAEIAKKLESAGLLEQG